MSDYASRADELSREIDAIQDKLPEEATRRMRQAVKDYMALRKDCLDELLTYLDDDSTSDRENARRWTDRSQAVRSALVAPLENALHNVVLATEAAALGYRWQLTTIANEDKFFQTLSTVNAAAVRDYLVANLQGLREYTAVLEEKWKTISGKEKELHSDEQRLYQEILETTKKVVTELTEEEKTLLEQGGQMSNKVLDVAKKAGDLLETVLNLPDGTGKLIEMAAEELQKMNESWLETNARIQGRISNYRSLLQAEKGGVLPLFKETRTQVYAYWEKNGTEVARDWIKKARESLEAWLSACPTSAQRDDAKRFYDEAYARVEKHRKQLEEFASEFEKRWNGIFKGALAPNVVDELMDSVAWKMNARTLVDIGTKNLVDALAKRLDGFYEVSFDDPLETLESAVRKLPEEQRAEGLHAVDAVKERVRTAIRDRIKVLQDQVGRSFAWFEPSSIERTFDRSALQESLE